MLAITVCATKCSEQRSRSRPIFNIAEGSERSGKDFARFLRISIGSAAELRTQSYIAAKVELIDNAEMLTIVEETKQLARMIQSLINKLDS